VTALAPASVGHGRSHDLAAGRKSERLLRGRPQGKPCRRHVSGQLNGPPSFPRWRCLQRQGLHCASGSSSEEAQPIAALNWDHAIEVAGRPRSDGVLEGEEISTFDAARTRITRESTGKQHTDERTGSSRVGPRGPGVADDQAYVTSTQKPVLSLVAF
jgi:hypothetical protein